MFVSLGLLISRFPRIFLSAAALVVCLSAFYGSDVIERLTLNPGWEVPDSGSARATVQLLAHTGRDTTPLIILFRAKAGTQGHADDPVFRDAVEGLLGQVMRHPEVSNVRSYYSSGDARMRTQAGDITYAMVMLDKGKDEGMAAFRRLRETLKHDALTIELGGELATYVDVRDQLAQDLQRAELVSFLALAVLLVWVFGSAVAAMLPLIIGGVTIILSAALLKFFTNYTDVNVYAANVVSMLGLGLAVDYGLFVVSRFREELAKGLSPAETLATTLATAGRTVAFSGLTVAVSLFCLLMLPQRFFQNMGLAGGISVAAAMLTTVLLLPAFLALLGKRVNKFAPRFLEKRLEREGASQNWYNFSRFVMRRAWLVLGSTLVILIFMGIPVWHLQITPTDSKTLPAGAESRRVQETLETSFPNAELSPLIISVKVAGEAHQGAGLAGVYAVTKSIEQIEGIKRLDGLASLESSFTLEDYQLLYEYPDSLPGAREALDNFAKGDSSLMLVYYASPPSSMEARELVRKIRAIALPKGVLSVDVGGFPASQEDYVVSLKEDMPMVVLAIVVVVFILLFLMLGSVFVPLKAVITNLISLSATYGGLVWIFQDGHFSDWLDFTPQAGLEGTVLMLIFASAFGLSIDYEVFLLSRIKEVCVKSGDSLEAIATGLQRSGPIITSAALLIGIVLGTFAMGEVVFMKAMGLGLLISVIVDATLVRMLLVPATLRLLGRWNWWAPAPLKRLYERMNMQH